MRRNRPAIVRSKVARDIAINVSACRRRYAPLIIDTDPLSEGFPGKRRSAGSVPISGMVLIAMVLESGKGRCSRPRRSPALLALGAACTWRCLHPALLALLLDLVERLGEALERILVGRLGAAARSSLHRQIGALAHGVDHARFLAGVLDPGAIALGVHGELGGADLGGGNRIGLERVADNDRHLVLHLVGGAGGHADRGRVALSRLPLRPSLLSLLAHA